MAGARPVARGRTRNPWSLLMGRVAAWVAFCRVQTGRPARFTCTPQASPAAASRDLVSSLRSRVSGTSDACVIASMNCSARDAARRFGRQCGLSAAWLRQFLSGTIAKWLTDADAQAEAAILPTVSANQRERTASSRSIGLRCTLPQSTIEPSAGTTMRSRSARITGTKKMKGPQKLHFWRAPLRFLASLISWFCRPAPLNSLFTSARTSL